MRTKGEAQGRNELESNANINNKKTTSKFNMNNLCLKREDKQGDKRKGNIIINDEMAIRDPRGHYTSSTGLIVIDYVATYL